jgi:hypothetical protein
LIGAQTGQLLSPTTPPRSTKLIDAAQQSIDPLANVAANIGTNLVVSA